MEILSLSSEVSKEDFWFNVCELKDKSSIAFPLDYFSYKCECDQEISFCKNGQYFLDGPVSNLVQRLEEEKTNKVSHCCENEYVLNIKHKQKTNLKLAFQCNSDGEELLFDATHLFQNKP